MTLDGLTLKVCTNEIKKIICGAKVQKILMPLKYETVFVLYSKEYGNVKLCINAEAGNCAIYLTSDSKPNPKTPPGFCMFLRKHLSSAKVVSASQEGCDRVFRIVFETKDELRRDVKLVLIAEIMGKYSNIILTDENGKILDSIKRVSVDVSSKRQILPGCIYSLPPSEKYDLLSLSENTLLEIFSAQSSLPVSNFIMDTFQGVSAQTAQEVISLSGFEDLPMDELSSTKRRIILSNLKELFEKAVSAPMPCVQLNGDNLPVFVSVLPYGAYAPSKRVDFSSCNKALDYYYTTRSNSFILRKKKDDLNKIIKKHITKLNKKIKIYKESLEDAKKINSLQKKGEYITCNIYRLKKGMSSFETTDYETGENITVNLDRTLSPSQNAQKLFKKASKLKTAEKINTKQLVAATEERDYLERASLFVTQSDDARGIQAIFDELVSYGYINPPKNAKKQKEEVIGFREFVSPSGYKILVGRNDKQNERLTMGIAEKSDIWFHTKNIPGSHVILFSRGKSLDEVDDESVLFAAALAAKYSGAKLGGKTPVDYTYKSNIKKPPASRPGKVIYETYYTLLVNPSDVLNQTKNGDNTQ